MIYQHQSSYNHGCEALIDTITEQMKHLYPKSDITVESFFKSEDEAFEFPCVDEFVQNTQWLRRFTFPWFLYQIDKRTLHSKRLQEAFMYCKPCYESSKEADVCVAVGGDTYCYNKGKEHWPLERKMRRLGKKMLLWGCSVEPEDVPGEMAAHLGNFDVITVRDPISYQALMDNRVHAKIVRCADPAFLLPMTACELPDGWEENKMIGLNFSPMVMGSLTDKGAPRRAIDALVEHILSTGGDQIVLIPHVRIRFTDDMDELRRIYEKYCDSGRVRLVDDTSLSARQLKYMISKCKMFVGARTHATIAAYSTCVPTLSIGYSVKARGIARDLFGREDGKTISIQSMEGRGLIKAFDAIYDHLDEERSHLEHIIPAYAKKALLSGEALRELMDCE